MSCKFLNIDGNLKNFDNLLTTLKSINQDFSIIALAETNINPEVKDTYAIPNYESVYHNKKENKRKGSGLGMYIHSSLNYQIKEELSSCSDVIESLFTEVKSISNSSPTIVGAIYRPPSVNPNSFIEKLSDLLSSLTPDSEAIILEDFNFNLFSQSNHTSTFEEKIFCNGFTPVISTATHKKPNCRFTRIDNIFVNNYERVISSCTLESHISHHRSLTLLYSLRNDPCSPSKLIKPKSKISYDYKPQNLDHLNEILAHNLSKTPIWQQETNFEEFLNLFTNCIDASCKVKNPKFSNRNKLDNPWITAGLINSISKRDRLYKIWKHTQTKRCTTGDPRLQEQYQKYRNMLSNLIKMSKQNYFTEQFERASGNMKKTWSIINRLKGKNQTSSSFCIKEGSSVITDEKIVPNKFNKHFCSLADNLNKNIRMPQACNFRDYLPPSQASSTFLEKTTTAEIISIIKEFENDKSSDIPIIVIKHCATTIAP